MSEATLRAYLKNIETAFQKGDATEHTHRPTLKALVETLSPGITATNEPKRIACGAPDFIITNKQTPLGYIETKDIGVSLDKTEHTDQMKRYLGSLANLILTDYLEFRWYVAGERRATARLAKMGPKGKLVLEPGGLENVGSLLQAFIVSQAPTVASPKELATRMAATAQLIRHAIRQAFESEDGGGSLHTQMQSFREVLLPDLTYEQFADMYAQTICYGLFAARCNAPTSTHFTREHAAYDIPKTNPFLRKMFSHIAGPDLDERIVWAVDDLAELLNRADMVAILQDFGKRTRQEDPVVHFYETFLAQYDPKMREARGVYYTPEPVVSYIVRSVDYLLKKDFGLPEGLADATKLTAASSDGKHGLETHKVQILDPATGTGTFLYAIINHIYETFKSNKGMWSGYVSQHLLPRLFGFELLMAPYTVAHMKLGLQLKQTGYDVGSNERLGVYLTNTLEEGYESGKLPFAEWLVEEATAAGSVKHDAPVMVVLGNPPYSGHSVNKGPWITHLLHGRDLQTGRAIGGNYFEVDGRPLGEQNPKYLLDDYVKFIRFAQWRIEQTGYGILAFITNHGYLDNPTFRGMRQSLIQSFDEIYLLDLHGNSKKKEHSPDGSKDENVFDIQQGVAIGIFVKKQSISNQFHWATVHHADLWGLRQTYKETSIIKQHVGGKYHWLASNDLATTQWMILNPQPPFYLFIPQDIDLLAEYQSGWRVIDIMPVNSTGVKTHRDNFVMDFDLASLRKRVENFRDLSIPDTSIAEMYDLEDTRDWKLRTRRRSLAANLYWNDQFTESLYRPFDIRAYFHHEDVVELPRQEVMLHMLPKDGNLGLIFMRQVALQDLYSHFMVTQHIVDNRAFYSNKGTMYLAPLYLYPDPNKKGLFDTNEPSNATGDRRPNLSPTFITGISNKLNMTFIPDGKGDLQHTFGPEDIFNYMYAVFHSSTYRERYAEFLKIDFPRLPLTSNADLFRELCKLGNRLVGLHLMETSGQITTSYPEAGNNVVEKVEYSQTADKLEEGRVWINKTQYFDGVPPEVWEFHVGGYQVCHKWLKDRKGRVLSYDDILHYQKIVAALAETMTLMEQVDEVIEECGGWPIE